MPKLNLQQWQKDLLEREGFLKPNQISKPAPAKGNAPKHIL